MSFDSDAVGQVDWAQLTTAQGRGGEPVVEALRSLWSPDGMTRKEAMRSLRALLVEGGRFSASVKAVPHLVDAACFPSSPGRVTAFLLLFLLAVDDEREWWRRGPSKVVAQLRGAESVSDRASPNAPQLMAEQQRTACYVETYDAVRAGVTGFIHALGSESANVRGCAVHLLGWFPEDKERIGQHIAWLLRGETDANTAATACGSVALLGTVGNSELVAAVHRRLTRGRYGERWMAAIALAHIQARPSVAVTSALRECLQQADQSEPVTPHLGGDMASLAAISIAQLPEDAARDHLDALLDRFVAAPVGYPSFVVIDSILQIAFPAQLRRDTAFEDLLPHQRRTILALCQNDAFMKASLAVYLFEERGLPADQRGLQVWTSQ